MESSSFHLWQDVWIIQNFMMRSAQISWIFVEFTKLGDTALTYHLNIHCSINVVMVVREIYSRGYLNSLPSTIVSLVKEKQGCKVSRNVNYQNIAVLGGSTSDVIPPQSKCVILSCLVDIMNDNLSDLTKQMTTFEKSDDVTRIIYIQINRLLVRSRR
jgi:hypothetical protein